MKPYTEVLNGVRCDMVPCTLADAALRCGPSFSYNLFVSAEESLRAHRVIKEIGASVRNHPFAPHVNVYVFDVLGRDERYLQANGKSFGSKGV